MFEQIGKALFAIGISYIAALVAGQLAGRLHVPKVTAYLVVGLLTGPSMAEIIGIRGLVSWQTLDSIRILSELALALIMVIIGAHFRLSSLRRWGRRLATLSLSEMLVTFVLVFATVLSANTLFLKQTFASNPGLWSSSLYIAVFTSIIAVAGAPAATLLVVREYESEGPITDVVLPLLGLNNFFAIILFDILVVLLLQEGAALSMVWEIGGSILIGFIGGLIISFWAQKLEHTLELQILFIGAIVVNIGASHLWHIDFFISCFIMGMTIINAAPKASQLLNAIKGVDYPLYVIFFIITGERLHIDALGQIGLLGFIYIMMRSAGKLIGSRLGAKLANFDETEQKWLGPALLAQAGVAIGLAHSLAEQWPEGGLLVETIILGSVVIFEFFGPITLRQSLVHAGEVPVLTLFAKRSSNSALDGMHQVLEQFKGSLGLPRGHSLDSAADILVEHIMRRNVETIREDMPFNEILKFISHSKYDRFPILNRAGKYIGVIDYSDIRDVLVDDALASLIVARDLMKPEPVTVTPDRKLGKVLTIFRDHSNMTYIPVVSCEDDCKLVGMISQNDVLAAFHIPNLKSEND